MSGWSDPTGSNPRVTENPPLRLLFCRLTGHQPDRVPLPTLLTVILTPILYELDSTKTSPVSSHKQQWSYDSPCLSSECPLAEYHYPDRSFIRTVYIVSPPSDPQCPPRLPNPKSPLLLLTLGPCPKTGPPPRSDPPSSTTSRMPRALSTPSGHPAA